MGRAALSLFKRLGEESDVDLWASVIGVVARRRLIKARKGLISILFSAKNF